MLFWWQNQEKRDAWGMWHIYGGRGAYRFWFWNLKKWDNLEDLGINGSIILKLIFKKWDGGGQPELIWLRTGMGAGTCECSNETLASIGMQGTSWPSQNLLAFRGVNTVHSHLSCCNEDCCHNVCSVCIEAPNAACNSWADQILGNIHIHQGMYSSLKNWAHHICWYNSFTNHRLATSLNPATSWVCLQNSILGWFESKLGTGDTVTMQAHYLLTLLTITSKIGLFHLCTWFLCLC